MYSLNTTIDMTLWRIKICPLDWFGTWKTFATLLFHYLNYYLIVNESVDINSHTLYTHNNFKTWTTQNQNLKIVFDFDRYL